MMTGLWRDLFSGFFWTVVFLGGMLLLFFLLPYPINFLAPVAMIVVCGALSEVI